MAEEELTPVIFRRDDDDNAKIKRLLKGHNLKSSQDALRMGLAAGCRELDLLEARLKAAQTKPRRKR